MSIYLHKVKSRWQPGENTVSYFPLQSDWLDVMWNYTLSNVWTQKTLWRNFTWQTVLNTTPTWINTTLVWMKLNTLWSANYVQVMRLMCWNLCFYVQWNASNPCFWMYVNPNTYEGWNKVITAWQRHLIWITREKNWTATTLKWYVDWVEYQIFSWTAPQDTADSQWLIFTNQTIDIDMSDFIMESKTWAKEEIEDYYMLTKWDYYTETPWEPNENTMIYMPMDWDAENKVDWTLWTWSWTETYYTLPSWIDVAHSNSSHYLLTPTIANSTPLTVSCWIYRNSWDPIVRADSTSWTRSFPQIWIGNNVWWVRFHYSWTWYWWDTTIGNWWHNVIWVFWANWIVWYIDWRKICESSFNSYLWRTQQRWIWYDQFMRNVPWDWYYSNLIIESKERSADEALSYYYQTRNDYVDNPWYPTKEYSVENIYIGEESWWKPGENTLLYYSFDNQDLTDDSGNNRNGSWYNWTWTYTDWIKWKWVNVASTRWITSPVYLPSWDFTYSIWCNVSSISSQLQSFLWTVQWSSSYPSFHFHFSSSNNICMGFSNWASDVTSSEKLTIWKWANIILVHSWNSWLIYKDKILIASWDRSVSLAQSWLTWTFGCEYTDWRPIQWIIDEIILENRAWTVEEIAEYYNSIASNYTTGSSSGVVDPWTAIK